MCNASLGVEDIRKDQCIDAGVKEFGSRHRQHFPHRGISEAVGYMCFQDVIQGRSINLEQNLKATCGHFLVDSLPSKMKERMKLLQTIAGAFL